MASKKARRKGCLRSLLRAVAAEKSTPTAQPLGLWASCWAFAPPSNFRWSSSNHRDVVELRCGSPLRDRCSVGPEGRERLPRLPLEGEFADVTPRLRAVWRKFSTRSEFPDHASSPSLQSDGRDEHFLSGTEKCCVSRLHAHCHFFRFRVRPARRGVSRKHNLLCPANGPRLSPWSSEIRRQFPDVALVSQSTWVSLQTKVGFGGRCRQRSGQLRDWRPESNCPSDQIQLESRWLFP